MGLHFGIKVRGQPQKVVGAKLQNKVSAIS